jgi:hypothetical protein
MKILKFLVFAALALAMIAACSTDYPSEEGPDLMTLHLSSTKWQLEDIRNLKTGKSRILEPLPLLILTTKWNVLSLHSRTIRSPMDAPVQMAYL